MLLKWIFMIKEDNTIPDLRGIRSRLEKKQKNILLPSLQWKAIIAERILRESIWKKAWLINVQIVRSKNGFWKNRIRIPSDLRVNS